jgi:hypothetical protein
MECVKPTDVLLQAVGVLQVQVGQSTVDVRAHLLSRLGRTKHPDHGDLGRDLALRRSRIASQDRIEVGRRSLVVVDAVQAEAESVHDDTALS